MSNEEPVSLYNTWNEQIRSLIKHENELIASRVGWMLTFHGFLFAALAYAWDKGVWQNSLLWIVILLCALGTLQAALSFFSILLADIAIEKLRGKWAQYNDQRRRRLDFKPELPPIWGWVNEEVHSGSRRIAAIAATPWLLLPFILIVTWPIIFLIVNSSYIEPLWQSLTQDSLKQVLLYDSPNDEKAQPGITALARIHGNADEGMKVFDNVCAGCHGAPKLYLMSANTADDLIKGDRNSVIVALVGANLHIRIYNAYKEEVVDMAENSEVEEKKLSGEELKAFKKKLSLLPDEFGVSQEQKQDIIREAISITRYAESKDKLIPKFDEFFEKYNREAIVRGILYPNAHKNLRCMEGIKDNKKITSCMENDLTTSISPKDFIDVIEYLKKPKSKWNAWPPEKGEFDCKAIVRGILYPNAHKNPRCMGNKITCMESDLITLLCPEQFIDVVGYLYVPALETTTSNTMQQNPENPIAINKAQIQIQINLPKNKRLPKSKRKNSNPKKNCTELNAILKPWSNKNTMNLNIETTSTMILRKERIGKNQTQFDTYLQQK